MPELRHLDVVVTLVRRTRVHREFGRARVHAEQIVKPTRVHPRDEARQRSTEHPVSREPDHLGRDRIELGHIAERVQDDHSIAHAFKCGVAGDRAELQQAIVQKAPVQGDTRSGEDVWNRIDAPQEIVEQPRLSDRGHHDGAHETTHVMPIQSTTTEQPPTQNQRAESATNRRRTSP